MKALSTAVALAAACATAQAQELTMKEQDGLRWVCGGVGVEERQALAALEPQANLKLLLVTEKRGGYLADVGVSLYDAGAQAPRLSVVADGPMCLIHAPAGRYRIEGSSGTVKRSATANVPKESKHPVRVVLSFPGEPWDGVWASDEEKRGARETEH